MLKFLRCVFSFSLGILTGFVAAHFLSSNKTFVSMGKKLDTALDCVKDVYKEKSQALYGLIDKKAKKEEEPFASFQPILEDKKKPDFPYSS